MNIREYLKHQVLITDGALGTYYDRKKSLKDQVAEEANVKDPDLIKKIHQIYIESGANLIRTNTFMLNRAFALTRRVGDFDEQNHYLSTHIKAACNIAKEAALPYKDVYIAADIGPIPEYLFSQYDYDEKSEYQFIIDLFLEEDFQIFNFETFADIEMIKWAAAYIKDKNPDAFVMASFSFDRYGYTNKGISMKNLFTEAANDPHIDCYGSNCSIGASHMLDLLEHYTFNNDKFTMILPNSGYPQIIRGQIVYSDQSTYFAQKISEIVSLGMNVVGGCCGTTPRHIKAVSDLLVDRTPAKKQIQIVETKDIKADSIDLDRNNPFLRKLHSGKKVIAVELDPPFDQNAEKVLEGAYSLKDAGVDIITLADSPLGRSRADSVLLATKIKQQVDIDVMPHLACRDRNRISMYSTILGAHINGIRNCLVVTGDPVPSAIKDVTTSVFDFNSISFMNYLKSINQESFMEDPICYGGALNQNQGIPERMVSRMQKKVEAGMSYFLTQPIYSNEDIERIRYFKEHVNAKFLCGIMPLVSYRNALFIKNEMPGIHVPDLVLDQYLPDMSRKEAEETAISISLDIIERLKDVADGYYFMTPFNRVSLIRRIIDRMEN